MTASQQIAKFRDAIALAEGGIFDRGRPSMSYEQRVQYVVDQIAQSSIKIQSGGVDAEIASVAKSKDISEFGLGGRAWAAFVKDVRAGLKAAGWSPSRASRPAAAPAYDYAAIASAASDAIGESFPDGDPNDAVELMASKKFRIGSDEFWNAVWPKCKKAFRALTGSSEIYEYAAGLWDQMKADGYEAYAGAPLGDDNPFR